MLAKHAMEVSFMLHHVNDLILQHNISSNRIDLIVDGSSNQLQTEAMVSYTHLYNEYSIQMN